MHLLPPLDSWDYFALLGAADVVLDPFPVGSLHAAVDAFALGTPVVTLPSRQRPGARLVVVCLQTPVYSSPPLSTSKPEFFMKNPSIHPSSAVPKADNVVLIFAPLESTGDCTHTYAYIFV